MADELYPKIMLLTTFLGTTSILFFGIAPIIQSGQVVNDPTGYMDTIQIPGESFYSPNPFAVDNASVKDHYSYTHESATFTSPVAHRHDIAAWIVRDNDYYDAIQPRYAWANDYKDCILFEMNYGIFNTKHKNAAVSYEAIVEQFDVKVNYSEVDFKLNSNYNLFISTGPGYSFPIGLYANQFNMSIGWLWNMSDAVSASPWALIGQIMTFSIPDVGYIMNLIIGIPVYLTMGFLLLAIISRFILTIPGL